MGRFLSRSGGVYFDVTREELAVFARPDVDVDDLIDLDHEYPEGTPQNRLVTVANTLLGTQNRANELLDEIKEIWAQIPKPNKGDVDD